MGDTFWSDGFWALLHANKPWRDHFIRTLFGGKYVNYTVNPYDLEVEDGIETFEEDKGPEVFNIYALCFDDVKEVYWQTLETRAEVKNLEFIMHNSKFKGHAPSNIIAINVLNLAPGIELATTGVFKNGDKSINVKFEMKSLSELYPYLDNMISEGVGEDFEHNSKCLICSVPIMKYDDYLEFYKVCHVISSPDAYADGLNCADFQDIFLNYDTDYLRFLEIVYDIGFEEGRRAERSA